MRMLRRLLQKEDGATATEYAVMLTLIMVAMISAITFFGQGTGGSFISTSDEIENAINGP